MNRFEEQFDAIIEEASLYREELKATISDLEKSQMDENQQYEENLSKLKIENDFEKYYFNDIFALNSVDFGIIDLDMKS